MRIKDSTEVAAFLFLLVNAALFIRPGEVIEGLAAVPIYNLLILANLAVASTAILRGLNVARLRSEPVTVCVLGLFALIPLSYLAHLNLAQAMTDTVEFAKVVLYYLLLVAVLDTPSRLRRFLGSLVFFTILLTTLALLHYHGYINIPSLEAIGDNEIDPDTGEAIVLLRLCSTGIYHDPNDLCMILLVATGACLFFAGDRRLGPVRMIWLLPIGLFFYALMLTHSRGGFLAMLIAMMVLFQARYGTRKAVALGCLALPAMFVLFAGRQTSISTSEDTGQDRIQLWAEGIALLRQSPVLGVGYNLYAEKVGLVAHNSFIHAFGELGLPGGALFLGAFAYPALTLLRLGRHADEILDDDLHRLRPYLTAMVAAYVGGMMTLSRNYVVPTYMVLGMTTAYFRLVAADSPQLAEPGGPILGVSARLTGWLGLLSIGFLLFMHVFIKVAYRPS